MGRRPKEAPRREWGTGSVYPVGKYWRVAISLGSDPGGRLRKQWQFTSKERAESHLRAIQSRLRRGLPPEESDVTLQAYIPQWLATLPARRKPSTVAFYESLAATHLDELRPYRLNRIRPQDIRDLLTAREKQGYASRTIIGILTVLRLIFRQAEGDGIVERNPTGPVEVPRLVQREPVHLTAEQARRFLEAAEGDDLYGLYAMALGTGLRRGELLALRWQDVDLERHVARVLRGKTASAARVVPLPAFAEHALRRDRDLRAPSVGLIFRVSPSHATRHVAVICAKAGVPRVTFHQLRHTYSTLMAEAGVNAETRRRMMGHSKTEMTLAYTHRIDSQERAAVEALERLVG